MLNRTYTKREEARDIMNILRPDSLLVRTQKERGKKATEASVQWRKDNPEKATEIGLMGGNIALELGVGIHGLSKEQMSEQGKKNYKEGKGMATLTKEERSKIGKTKGKANLVGTIICEKCGRKTNKGNYAKIHGDNCREKNIIELIDLLPNKFTKAIVKEIATKYEIENWEKWNIFHELCIYTKCIIKVERPNQFNPCWYGKNKTEINKVKKFIDDKKRNSKNC